LALRAFVDGTGNEKYRIRVNARVIIVSSGVIASSNLLQRSGVANKNIGKGLALHPAPFVMGHFKEKIYGNGGIQCLILVMNLELQTGQKIILLSG